MFSWVQGCEWVDAGDLMMPRWIGLRGRCEVIIHAPFIMTAQVAAKAKRAVVQPPVSEKSASRRVRRLRMEMASGKAQRSSPGQRGARRSRQRGAWGRMNQVLLASRSSDMASATSRARSSPRMSTKAERTRPAAKHASSLAVSLPCAVSSR